jgi:tight adherence protein B
MLMAVATLGIGVAMPLLLGFANMLGSDRHPSCRHLCRLRRVSCCRSPFLDRKAMKRIKKFEEQFPLRSTSSCAACGPATR